MAAGRYDFTLTQGQTFTESWNWNDGIDLTGYTCNLRIFEGYDDAPILALNASQGITLNAADPNINVTITAGQSTLMDFETARHDFELIDASGLVTKALYGFITMVKENV
tara:strand:+ start:299 stop:628 length:330 start_codon:yes stop_codon:yes gene_type:complete